jgi:hypothetical protein
MESMPSACYTGVGGLPSSLYTKRHNPFVSCTDVLDNGCAEHVVQYPGVSGLVAALDGAGAPDFVWISPNLYDDMHSAQVTAGDNWLQANLGPVLASPWFTSSNATVGRATTSGRCAPSRKPTALRILEAQRVLPTAISSRCSGTEAPRPPTAMATMA